MSIRKQIDDIYNEVKLNLNNASLVLTDQKSLFQILKYIIECIEKHDELKGEDKTLISERVVRMFIQNKEDITIETREMFLMMVDSGAIRETIHLIIAASKGNIDVNKKRKFAMSCLSCLFTTGSSLSKQHTKK